MKKSLAFVALALGLSACATPMTMMKNPENAQLVQCGGERSGAIMLGAIGYAIQSGDASDCVKRYSAQGFVILNDGVKAQDPNNPTKK